MRTRMFGVMVAAGLLIGMGAAPAAAQGQGPDQGYGSGCTVIGEEWSWWAQQGPDFISPIGPWTANFATSQEETDFYPVGDGPGTIARLIEGYCSGQLPLDPED